MNKRIIIVAGYLASGKSTFALRLSEALHVPYLMKDTFKSALCASIPISNRKESRCFSAITFDAMIYVAQRLFEVGYPVILEGNFVPAGVKKTDEAGVIKGLLNKYAYHPLTFKFTGGTPVLYERFIKRDKLPGRGQANAMFTEPSFEEFDKYCHTLDGFNAGGEIIDIDTTDFNRVDFERLVETARSFMDPKSGG